MPPRTVASSNQLAAAIKERRESLGLSIEEAAKRADVGTRTWSRYESGYAIRSDKIKGVCKALSWTSIPSVESLSDKGDKNDFAWLEAIDESHEAWSSELAACYGRKAAVSFAVGSDLLLDEMDIDLEELKSMPKGTHLGELSCSRIADMLPEQFAMEYDYDFLYHLRAMLVNYRQRAASSQPMAVHTVAEELLVRMIQEKSFPAVEGWTPQEESELESELDENWDDWPVEICSDDDFSLFLSSGSWLPEDDPYHFVNWFKPQFFLEEGSDPGEAIFNF